MYKSRGGFRILRLQCVLRGLGGVHCKPGTQPAVLSALQGLLAPAGGCRFEKGGRYITAAPGCRYVRTVNLYRGFS